MSKNIEHIITEIDGTTSNGLSYKGDYTTNTCKITGFNNSSDYIEIPSYIDNFKVTTIETDAFKNSNINTVVIPETVNNINRNAFLNSKKLMYIIVKGNVPNMNWDAFNGCDSKPNLLYNKNTNNYKANNISLRDVKIYINYNETEEGYSINSIERDYEYPYIIIPLMHNNKPVISINNFENSDKLIRIFFELDENNKSNILNIDSYAFMSCLNLINIDIPNSVTNINLTAFNQCNKLQNINVDINNNNYSSVDGILYNKNLTKLIKFPSNSSIKYFEMLNITTSIETNAFLICKELVDVKISNNVNNIGHNLFGGCSKLNSITIPSSVTKINENPFIGCSNLYNINVDSINTIYSSLNGVLFNKDKTSIIRYPEGKKEKIYTIPNGVIDINRYAFTDTNLTSIIISNSVVNINTFAFSSSHELTSITIPENVKMIDNFAFYNSRKLNTIIFEGSLPIIGNNAFYDISDNVNIYYPKSWTNNDIDTLKTFTNKNFLFPEFYFSLNNDGSGYIVNSYIGSNTDVIIPITNLNKPVVAIGNNAFYNRDDLTSVKLQIDSSKISNITSIGGFAFMNCTRLSDITIPDSVTLININAFSNTRIKSINIPAKINTLGDYIFNDCIDLQSINVNNNNNNYSSINGVLFNKNKTTLIKYPEANNSQSYTIPPSVITLYMASFNKVNLLRYITIPSNVLNIDKTTFWNDSIQNIIVDGNNPKFSSIDGILFNKDKTILLKFPSLNTNTSYIIPDSVNIINNFAFNNCNNIKSLTISQNVISLYESAIYNCPNLISLIFNCFIPYINNMGINIVNNLRSIYYPNFWKLNEKNYLNTILKRDVEYIISQFSINIKSDFDFVVENNTCSIKSYTGSKNNVIIPLIYGGYPVVSINNSAFNAKPITSVIFQKTEDNESYIKNIFTGAFMSCDNIKTITIPSSVTNIESLIFSGCKNITSINVEQNNNNYSSVNGILFNKNQTNLIQYPIGLPASEYTVPQNVLNINEYAFAYSVNLTKINIYSNAKNISPLAFNASVNLNNINIINQQTKNYSSIDGVLFQNNQNIPFKLVRYPQFKQNKSYKIPNNITTISEYAFYGSSILTEITIPETVVDIYKNAFSNCPSLVTIIFEGYLPNIPDIIFYSNKNNITVYHPNSWTKNERDILNTKTDKSLIYPDYTFSLISNKYYTIDKYHGIDTEINIPFSYNNKNIIGISKDAFYNANIIKVNFMLDKGKSYITTIGENAFYGCTRLETITIPNSVNIIGDSAFMFNSLLKTINIPPNIKIIGSKAFYGCESMISFNVDTNCYWFGSDNGVLWGYDKDKKNYLRINYKLLYQYPIGKKDESYTIPSDIYTINDDAFYNAYYLKTINMPNFIKIIGNNAFNGCINLNKINFYNKLPKIGTNAFYNISDDVTVYHPSSWDNDSKTKFRTYSNKKLTFNLLQGFDNTNEKSIKIKYALILLAIILILLIISLFILKY